MTISLSQMIADLNAKIAAADSNTPISEILELATDAERLGGGTVIYDSSAVLPSDSAYEGMIAFVADSATLKVRGDYGWADIADSASVYVAPPVLFQPGSISGYVSGGFPGSGGLDVIQKFPFSVDENSTDVGDLTVARHYPAGQSSRDNGYTSGGSPYLNIIDKFPFSTDANAADVGDLTRTVAYAAGQSSGDNGYTSAGWEPGNGNVIDKFPFSTDANAADVGDTTAARYHVAGHMSTVSGYTSGGTVATPALNVIDKFPFSTDANAADVGDLSVARYYVSGQSSTDNGYTSGGGAYGVPPASAYRDTIDKFPFAADGNATDVGNLAAPTRSTATQSSTASGYNAGGSTGLGTRIDVIQKFSFTSDGNATDVGDILSNTEAATGQQV